jgi:hypothetical protein
VVSGGGDGSRHVIEEKCEKMFKKKRHVERKKF